MKFDSIAQAFRALHGLPPDPAQPSAALMAHSLMDLATNEPSAFVKDGYLNTARQPPTIDLRDTVVTGLNDRGIWVMAGFAFGGATNEKLNIFYSLNGRDFSMLGFEVYAGGGGAELTVRDPSLFFWKGQFWIAYTQSTEVGESTFTPGTTFGLASSTNLKDWTWVADVSVPRTGSGTYYVWQPCWFLDANGAPHVFVVASVRGSGNLPGIDSTVYELHPTNDALTAWSAPVATDLPVTLVPQNVWYDSATSKYYAEGFGAKPYTSSSLLTGYTLSGAGDWTPLGATDGFGVCVEAPGQLRVFADYQVISSGNALPFAVSTDSGATWSTETGVSLNFGGLFKNPSLRFYSKTSAAYAAFTAIQADQSRRDADDSIYNETDIIFPHPRYRFASGASGYANYKEGGSSGYPFIQILASDVGGYGVIAPVELWNPNGPIEWTNRQIVRFDFQLTMPSVTGKAVARFLIGGDMTEATLTDSGVGVEWRTNTSFVVLTRNGGSVVESAPITVTRPGSSTYERLIIDANVGLVNIYYAPSQLVPAALVATVTTGPRTAGGANTFISVSQTVLATPSSFVNVTLFGGRAKTIMPLTKPAL